MNPSSIESAFNKGMSVAATTSVLVWECNLQYRAVRKLIQKEYDRLTKKRKL